MKRNNREQQRGIALDGRMGVVEHQQETSLQPDPQRVQEVGEGVGGILYVTHAVPAQHPRRLHPYVPVPVGQSGRKGGVERRRGGGGPLPRRLLTLLAEQQQVDRLQLADVARIRADLLQHNSR